MRHHTLKKLIDKGKSSFEICEIIKENQDIVNELEQIERELSTNYAEYIDKRNQLQIWKMRILNKCPHYEVGYQPTKGTFICSTCRKESSTEFGGIK